MLIFVIIYITSASPAKSVNSTGTGAKPVLFIAAFQGLSQFLAQSSTPSTFLKWMNGYINRENERPQVSMEGKRRKKADASLKLVGTTGGRQRGPGTGTTELAEVSKKRKLACFSQTPKNYLENIKS